MKSTMKSKNAKLSAVVASREMVAFHTIPNRVLAHAG